MTRKVLPRPAAWVSVARPEVLRATLQLFPAPLAVGDEHAIRKVS